MHLISIFWIIAGLQCHEHQAQNSVSLGAFKVRQKKFAARSTHRARMQRSSRGCDAIERGLCATNQILSTKLQYKGNRR